VVAGVARSNNCRGVADSAWRSADKRPVASTTGMEFKYLNMLNPRRGYGLKPVVLATGMGFKPMNMVNPRRGYIT